MPEGPEIKLAADRLAKALVGKKADEVFFAFEHLKLYQTDLAGQDVVGVTPKSKALLIRFANNLSVYSHNQLYGRWELRKPYQFPRTNRQLRLAIHNSDRSALLYSASDIEVLDDNGIKKHPFLKKLGPDVLDESVTVRTLLQRFRQKAFVGRRLAGLLLDQSFLCGLGNYLQSEILFVSRVHPSLRLKDLDSAQLNALAHSTLDITRQAYRTKGVTNDLTKVKVLKAEGQREYQFRHHVFARSGQECYECGTIIHRENVAGCRIYYCPNCQAK